ncbi:hypothetical protein PSTEL_12000 [Paenibacillus stellifer]|uniref:Ketosynthase family 3 (KS3) domain-containing protein n=1 Tax=Paenibacillus stellifer TaxID=169760 RepID=A0A089LQ73_9BACL|nr:beta-ketoacyl synthase N-terminal-like domain-containing protein [Paenibacillus stellifer]AIQ63696.1 hypothetical protein PSTEL_12000 [Paenibacillus stellifer]
MKHRYVITGLGQVSSMGNDMSEMRSGFSGDKTGFAVEHRGESAYPVAKATGFDFYKLGFQLKTYADRVSQLCACAARQAIGHSELELEEDDADAAGRGLLTASQFGCLDSASRYLHQLKTLKKSRFASPLYFMHSICNMPNSITATELRLKGVSNHLAGSSESGLMTLWQGIRFMESGQSEYVIAGGADGISDELIGQLHSLGLLGTGPEPARWRGPFDQERKHAVWGEAAAFVRMEKEETALRGGKRVYGVVKGIGMATSASGRSRARAIEEAMRAAIERSGIRPGSLSFVAANANGTMTADWLEAAAIEAVCGPDTPVYAPKSYFGETSSAAGLLGIVSVLALTGERLPVNRHTYEPDRRIALNVGYGDREKVCIRPGDHFIVNGYNRGGVSVSVCIEVYGGGSR